MADLSLRLAKLVFFLRRCLVTLYVGNTRVSWLQLEHLLHPKPDLSVDAAIQQERVDVPKLCRLYCCCLLIQKHCLDVARSTCVDECLVLFLRRKLCNITASLESVVVSIHTSYACLFMRSSKSSTFG